MKRPSMSKKNWVGKPWVSCEEIGGNTGKKRVMAEWGKGGK